MYLYPGAPQRWAVLAGPRGLAEGQDITFFYPSTEWDMAQGFDCACGATVSASEGERSAPPACP